MNGSYFKRLCWPIALWTTFIALGGCEPYVEPTLPPLLRDATAASGYGVLCEPPSDFSTTLELAVQSPEIRDRLINDFPPGSPASLLRSALIEQGFNIQANCSLNKSIHWARFQATGQGANFETIVLGMIYWTEDDRGKVVWTSGNILYSGR